LMIYVRTRVSDTLRQEGGREARAHHIAEQEDPGSRTLAVRRRGAVRKTHGEHPVRAKARFDGCEETRLQRQCRAVGFIPAVWMLDRDASSQDVHVVIGPNFDLGISRPQL
jgi:hypothetical protein